MPRPKKGATKWSLNIRDVPIGLYWLFDDAINKAKREFGEWALEVLARAAREVIEKETAKSRKTKV